MIIVHFRADFNLGSQFRCAYVPVFSGPKIAYHANMVIKWKTVLLKTVPYVLSVAGGVVLFIITIHSVHDPKIAGLMNDISGSLLAIPFVFLLYDYSNYHISKKLNDILTETQNDKINALIMNTILLLRQILGIRGKLTAATLEKMGTLRAGELEEKLNITSATLNTLHTYRTELDNLIYYNAKNDILSVDEIQILTGLSRDMQRLITQHRFQKNKKISAKYIESIFSQIADWLDSNAVADEYFQKMLQPAPK